jgi:hypothetical protein
MENGKVEAGLSPHGFIGLFIGRGLGRQLSQRFKNHRFVPLDYLFVNPGEHAGGHSPINWHGRNFLALDAMDEFPGVLIRPPQTAAFDLKEVQYLF